MIRAHIIIALSTDKYNWTGAAFEHKKGVLKQGGALLI